MPYGLWINDFRFPQYLLLRPSPQSSLLFYFLLPNAAIFKWIGGAKIQCDQIVFSILAIYNYETLPNSIHYLAKVGPKFCPKLYKPSNNCQIH